MIRVIKFLFALVVSLALPKAALVAATGSWNGIAFTALNGVVQTSWNGTGISCAGGGGTPAFGAEIARTSATFNGNATEPFALTGSASTGQVITIFIGLSNGVTISGVTDDASGGSNTYTQQLHMTGQSNSYVFTAPVSHAMTSANTITASFSGNSFRIALVLTSSNCTATQAAATNGGAFGTTATSSATSTADASVIGFIVSPFPLSLTSTNGTAIGATLDYTAGYCQAVYKNTTGAGSQTTSGTAAVAFSNDAGTVVNQ